MMFTNLFRVTAGPESVLIDFRCQFCAADGSPVTVPAGSIAL